jgi:hypothetical protein
MNSKEKAALNGIADTLKKSVPPDVCFVLFLQSKNGSHYISNGHRDDILNALEEWLMRTSGALDIKPIPETSGRVDERLELERLCATIGKAFADISRIALFLFDVGDNGSAAYFTNVANARESIAAWVKRRRGLS